MPKDGGFNSLNTFEARYSMILKEHNFIALQLFSITRSSHGKNSRKLKGNANEFELYCDVRQPTQCRYFREADISTIVIAKARVKCRVTKQEEKVF